MSEPIPRVEWTEPPSIDAVAADTALASIPGATAVALVVFGQDRRRTGRMVLRVPKGATQGVDTDILVRTFRDIADAFERESRERMAGAADDAGVKSHKS